MNKQISLDDLKHLQQGLTTCVTLKNKDRHYTKFISFDGNIIIFERLIINTKDVLEIYQEV